MHATFGIKTALLWRNPGIRNRDPARTMHCINDWDTSFWTRAVQRAAHVMFWFTKLRGGLQKSAQARSTGLIAGSFNDDCNRIIGTVSEAAYQ
jgi:hypothetical protein